MARVRSSGVNRAGLYGLAGFGDVSRTAITGVDSVDRMLYDVKDKLDTFELAMTVTTISSLAAGIGVLLLIWDGRKR